jgi:sulfate transport system permease protein
MSIEMTVQRGRAASPTKPDATGAASVHAARDNLRTEPPAVRIVIIALAVTFLSVFVVLPLVVVFAQAFSKGIGAYLAALSASTWCSG